MLGWARKDTTCGRLRGWKSIKNLRCTSSSSWRRGSVRDRWEVQAKVRRRSGKSWHGLQGPQLHNKKRPRAIWKAKLTWMIGNKRRCRAIITTFQSPAHTMKIRLPPSTGTSSALQAYSPPKRSSRSQWMLHPAYESPNLTFNNWNYQNISLSSLKCSLDQRWPRIRSAFYRTSSPSPSSIETLKRITMSSTFESLWSCKRPTASISSHRSTWRASSSCTRSRFALWARLSK